MGIRTSLVARMSVLLIALTTFVFAESVVAKPLCTPVNAVTRTAGLPEYR
jgi:hypothetical protein